MHFVRSRPAARTFAVAAVILSLLVCVAMPRPVVAADAKEATPKLELKKGDHICIIGNTLAERMQHDGWLETLIHARYPQHELVFRNLGYSGDEVDGFRDPNKRMRSMDFGSQDQWLAGSAPVPQPGKIKAGAPVSPDRFALTNTKADVIFAFYGYNESFAGEAGLPKFKENLEAFIKHTLSQKYNGNSAPRLVLFSPTPMESFGNPNLPSQEAVAATNARIKMYSDAMAQVANANGVTFVDVFAHMLQFAGSGYSNDDVHLNGMGDRLMANIAVQLLFGPWPVIEQAGWEKKYELLRKAVNDKNFYWFHRYRTTDGYSTYGDRAFLQFVDAQTNYEVVQRELEQLDIMTANRDKRVWAVAQGKDFKVDDSNIPAPIPVVTNKPGPLPGGKHLFLGGEQAIEKMTVAQGMKVSLFASEEKFPELQKPVQMAFDTKGRLWVAAWASYPHWKPNEEMNDKLLILEDIDGDGKADKCTTFADHLHNPTGFEFWGGGVLVAMAPDLLFIKDTDGDDKADVRQRVLHGLDTADTHHTANSFTLDPGGALYFQEGTFHHTQVETPYGPPVRCANAGVYRYEPRSQKFDVYISYGFANPHGHVFDAWGQDIVVDGTGSDPFHAALFSGHLDYPHKHNRPPTVYPQRTRPCPGIEVLSSRHFPDENQGNLLVANVIGVQGILQYKVADNGASFGATEVEPIVLSSDPNFRPADLEIGPDGAIWFTDWQNPIIGHMQHNLRDPSRDREHGRVYRVTYEGRPLSQPSKIAGEPVDKLLNLLKDPENRIRHRARIELSGRVDLRPHRAFQGTTTSPESLKAVDQWIAALDKNDPQYEHTMLEALWLYQQYNHVNVSLLERELASPDFRARAAATRVLCYWRDRVSNALDLVKRMAADPHPRVRLEAVRAASFFPTAEAVEVSVIAAEQPKDAFVEFTRAETMRTLEPYWKQALAEGRQVAFTTSAGARYLLRNIATEQLLKMDRNRAVCLEMLYRPGLRDENRREAVSGLAKLDNKPELRVVMDAIGALDEKQDETDASVVFDLVRQLTGRSAAELATARAELERLATSARQPILRQIGFVALINVDGSVDRAWTLATQSVNSLRDFLSAMPLIPDASVRASLYPKLEPLLTGLPEPLAASAATTKGTVGRFVRVELPRTGTLTLAEVEVTSEGRNVARQGKASQKNTANGGEAQRAIDGNKKGEYGAGGQTHSIENSTNPWWEVDLGEEVPIESITIYNRTDGDLGKRLDGFTLTVLDKGRGKVFELQNIAAPAASATLALEGSDPATAIRRGAMVALTHIRGQEAKTFGKLARFVVEGKDLIAAVRALERIPRADWPKEQAGPLLGVLLTYVRKIPPQERTSPEAVDALEFADALASLLPAADAKQARAELGELGVRVIRVGTLLERMSYDKDVIAVRAGKPVEFILENSDLMPHNFVIARPGSMEELGLMAEATAQEPSAAERHYVPQSDKVLLASTLLQPRESRKLSFNVPAQPGVYPYVCTYPGHWRRMYGALYVVENLDAYLENPESYLASHPLEIKDELLKDRRPRTEWKLEDLASAVEHLDGDHGMGGRSYGNGKQLFTVANCVACHKMDGAGTAIGPDLVKLEDKFTPLDILKEMIDPSARINEKFQTYIFELDSGKVVTGIIVEETADAVKIVENPLLKADPTVVKPGEITSRQKSATSIMPKGLLDKLSREEILDLVAYVAARGDKESLLFHGGHQHEH